MKNGIHVYLAIDNQMLSRGFESIIEKSDGLIKIETISNLKGLAHQHLIESPTILNVLICEASKKEENIHLVLRDLNVKHPNFRTIVLLDDFNLEQAKLLFNLGVYGVVNKNIDPDEFIRIYKEILNGAKCLSPKFKESLFHQFCQKDEKVIENIHDKFFDLASMVDSQQEQMVEQFYGITCREKEILFLICEGKSTREISEELFISLHTVETHRRNLINKLDVKNTAEMVKVALTSKLISA